MKEGGIEGEGRGLRGEAWIPRLSASQRYHNGLFLPRSRTHALKQAATGKPLSKCGKCKRFMKYIHLKPQRLHCPTCNETYALPQVRF